MLQFYLIMLVIGAVVTYRAFSRKDRKRTVAGTAGILLSIMAVITGFSIGPLFALLAAMAIGVAANPVAAQRPQVTKSGAE